MKKRRKDYIRERYKTFPNYVFWHSPFALIATVTIGLLGLMELPLGLITCIPLIGLISGYYMNWIGEWE